MKSDARSARMRSRPVHVAGLVGRLGPGAAAGVHGVFPMGGLLFRETQRVGRIAFVDAGIFDEDERRLRVGVGQAEVVVEPGVQRAGSDFAVPERVVIRLTRSPAEVPFSKRGGVVAVVLEDLREEDFVLGEIQGWLGALGTPVVAPGKNAIARGLADGGRRMGVGELHSLGGEFVDVRRLEQRRSVAADIPVAEVVCEHEDEVGFFDRLLALGRGCLSGKGQRDGCGEKEVGLFNHKSGSGFGIGWLGTFLVRDGQRVGAERNEREVGGVVEVGVLELDVAKTHICRL